MVVLTTVVVVMRYLFDQGSIVLQEAVLYLHGAAFMLGIPYTLKHDGHVRVDIVYARLTDRGRAVVNLAGHLLFLVPVSVAILVYSRTYVGNAWRILEASPEVGGIPGIFLLKSLIPLLAVLLLVQGTAEILRCLAALAPRRG